MPLVVADNIGYMSAHEPRLRSGAGGARAVWTGCAAGLGVVGITSDGRVRGCLSLPPALDEGSLRERALAHIWGDPAAFAYTRRFRVEQLAGACAGCALGAVCRGGCTAMSMAASGVPHRYPCCLRRLAHGAAPAAAREEPGRCG